MREVRDHPVIEQMERTGYPSKEYIDWEIENEREEDEE